MRPIEDFAKQLETISDEALMRRTEGLAAQSNRVTAALILHMAEVERRGAHLRLGFGSLYAYCTEQLGLSEGAAYQRIRAARVARRFPEVASMLAAGELHLSGLALLSARLDAERGSSLLRAAKGKSKREIEKLIAELEPAPTVPDRIRRLPPPRSVDTVGSEARTIGDHAPAAIAQLIPASADSKLAAAPTPAVASRAAVAPGPSLEPLAWAERGPVVEPLASAERERSVAPLASAERERSVEPLASTESKTTVEVRPLGRARYRVQLTGGAALIRALEKCRALSAHSLHGELGAVVEAALEQYAAHLEKRRFGIGAKARKKKPEEPSSRGDESARAVQGERESSEPAVEKGKRGKRTRYVTAETRRQVVERDGLRCSFRGPDGRRCSERTYLELDHWRPFALGGSNEAGNLRLLCRAHNQARIRAMKVE